MPTHVHLVGSVALDTSQDVYSTAGKLLGPYLERLPDGETGWAAIVDQLADPVAARHPQPAGGRAR